LWRTATRATLATEQFINLLKKYTIMKTNDYQKQANDFATKHGVKLQILGSERKSMWDEQQSRTVFRVKLSRKGKSYTFEFGQSIAAGNEDPTMYDILTCLTKYDPESFDNFCSEYGYDTDSRKAEKTYKAVCKEFEAVDRLFGDVIDELAEIQ